MTKLTIILRPEEGSNNYVYNYGAVNIALSLDRTFKCTDTYTLLLYNEQLMLLEDAATDDVKVMKRGRDIEYFARSKRIWIPGKYFLLLRNGKGETWRFDVRLDEHGFFHTEATRECPRMSDEDMLSGKLYLEEKYWVKLSRMPGTMQLKRWALERAKKNELNELRAFAELGELDFCNNMLVSSKNVDQLSSAVLLLLHVAKVESKRGYANCATFYDVTKNNPYEAMDEFFSKKQDDILWSSDSSDTKHHTYVFDNVGALLDTGGKIVMKTILNYWPCTDSSAIFMGTSQELETLLEQTPSLQKQFPKENRLTLVPYSREEIILSFFEELESAHLKLTAEAADKVCRLITEAYQRGVISHWDKTSIKEYVQSQLLPQYCQSAIHSIQTQKEEGRGARIYADDIEEDFFLSQRSSYSEVLRELNEMVGLKEVKQSIVTLTNRTKFYQERHQLGLHSSDDTAYHTILTGNPGTGKTTVARLLGKIYHSLGLLSKGEVVCVDRTKIIGRYIGETEENMKQILKEAQGNVLFVDEAYTLYNGDDDKDFGRHAVECLLDVLSRKDPDMLVVFAGYEKEMDGLMSSNPGLVGRFPYKYHFENYSAEELLQIAEKILEKDDYVLTPEAQSLLSQTIRKTVAGKPENFANARWVNHLVKNGIIPALADRITHSLHTMDRVAYQRIEAADVKVAAEKFCPKPKEIKRRPVIGFCA